MSQPGPRRLPEEPTPPPGADESGTAAPSPVVVPMPLARSARPAPEPERIGDLLRRAREKRGEALEDIAGWLRIRPTFLAALEQSRYAELPAADAYVTGFLRSYAVYLGFDPKMAIERYRYEMAGQQRKPQLVLPQPLPEGRGPTLVVLLAAALAALLVYALWYSASAPDRPATPPAPSQVEAAPPVAAPQAEQQLAPVVVPTAAAPAPATSLPSVQTPAPVASAPPVPLPAVTAPVPASSASAASPTPPPVLAPAAVVAPAVAAPSPVFVAPALPPSPVPGPSSIALPVPLSAIPTLDKTPPAAAAAPVPPARAAASEAKPVAAPPKDKAPSAQAASKPSPVSGPGRMTIRAEQESWILIADPQGNTVYEKVLRPGETWRVPATKGLTMTTGNGGAIVVNLDGADLPHFAEEGRAVRAVPLDPDKLRARVPPPPRKQPEAPRDAGTPPAAGL